MAGLVAAARARELGADVTVYEKGDRPGGSMLLSSCVPWRYVEWDEFRRACPDGIEELQRVVWERFDDGIAWLERTTGVEPEWGDTKNPRTTGRRYDPRALTNALVERAGPIRLREPFPHEVAPLVLATGGFPVRFARERGLLVRSNPWSEGDGLEYARANGAALAGDLGEVYARAMPAPPVVVEEADFVRLSQLYGGRARVVSEEGVEFFPDPPAWHENDLAQAIAGQPSGTAWFELEDGRRVHVIAGITHTLGGIRVDARARVVGEDGAVIDGLYAAGVDVGGIASGGYASGLAQALVQGLVAAETALSGGHGET